MQVKEKQVNMVYTDTLSVLEIHCKNPDDSFDHHLKTEQTVSSLVKNTTDAFDPSIVDKIQDTTVIEQDIMGDTKEGEMVCRKVESVLPACVCHVVKEMEVEIE